ncbi:MAG: 4Fe-4S dicluster domain-containing protein [Lachnospiraceae bacterium]|jgi:ferredoxin|nr:4Fe-4S dicluster domain-containing protein [Lachnospiraceae bacterium]
MLRQIIKIDEELCNGCGLCVNACHEAAIGLVDGKAKLLRDDYCDGLGNCLPVCPTGAISFEEREALPYNEEEVKRNTEKNMERNTEEKGNKACGCPGARVRNLDEYKENPSSNKTDEVREERVSMLRQWPVQIQLVPPNAPYFENADLLIAADCTAYAYGDIHSFMKNKVTLIGCPKLDDVDYSEKLTQILSHNDIKSITVLRMEVPCCGGIVNAIKSSFLKSGKMVPWNVVTIGIDGTVMEDR